MDILNFNFFSKQTIFISEPKAHIFSKTTGVFFDQGNSSSEIRMQTRISTLFEKSAGTQIFALDKYISICVHMYSATQTCKYTYVVVGT